jgi:TorA maturation chaperone TorD
MSAVLERVVAAPALSEEDRARAEQYAVLSRLFAGAPDGEFLHKLQALAAVWGSSDSALGQAWRELGEAAASVEAEAVEDEYTRTFLTIGRPEVMLFGSFYIAGFLMEEPVVELRNDLAELGLGRRFGVTESEDHIAALCDVMRHLIVTGPDAAGLARQQLFFARHIAPWFGAFGDALERAPDAVFYPRTANLVRTFFEIERLAFDML